MDAENYDGVKITVLEGPNAVRLRPMLYVGPLTDSTLMNRLVQEAMCLAIDEVFGGFCSEIIVEIGPGHNVRVRDNGRGFPMELTQNELTCIEVLLTLHLGCRDLKQYAELKEICCEIGLAAVCALSEWFVVKNYRDGACWVQEYRCGKAVAPIRREFETSETGLEFTFHPDMTIFKSLEFNAEALSGWLQRIGVRSESLEQVAVRPATGETLLMRFVGLKAIAKDPSSATPI